MYRTISMVSYSKIELHIPKSNYRNEVVQVRTRCLATTPPTRRGSSATRSSPSSQTATPTHQGSTPTGSRVRAPWPTSTPIWSDAGEPGGPRQGQDHGREYEFRQRLPLVRRRVFHRPVSPPPPSLRLILYALLGLGPPPPPSLRLILYTLSPRVRLVPSPPTSAPARPLLLLPCACFGFCEFDESRLRFNIKRKSLERTSAKERMHAPARVLVF